MDTRPTNNYSLAHTNGFTLLKEVVFFFMEKFGESFGAFYDTLTLDTSQAVKRQIDNSVANGHLGQILSVIQEILKETKYLFNTPTSSNNSNNNNNNNNSTSNNFNNTLPKSFSSPNFYSTSSASEENISLSSTPNGSSIYSTPGNSTFLSTSQHQPPSSSFDSASTTPNGSNSPNSNSNNLSADQLKIKQLELELLKFKEAAAAMMNLKQMANQNNTSSPSKATPPPASLPPPPPPPPPPVFKQPTINLKRGASSPNLSVGGSQTQPPQFNIQEILTKKPLLKKVNLDRSPGGTPSKDRPKSGVEDVFKAILHKFKNENNHNQSPCKNQTDDESSDSDFE